MAAALAFLLNSRKAIEFADICAALKTQRADQASLEQFLNASALTVRTKRGLYKHTWPHYAETIARAADHVAIHTKQWLITHASEAPDIPLIAHYVHQHCARYGLHAISSCTVRQTTTYNIHGQASLKLALEAAGYSGMASADLYQEYAAAYHDVQALIQADYVRCFHGRVWICAVMCKFQGVSRGLSPFG